MGICCCKKIPNRRGFRFGKRRAALINRTGWQARVASPLPAIIAVQIHAKRAVAIVAAVFAPQSAAAGVLHPVVLVAVRVDAGQQNDVAGINEAGHLGICAILRRQGVSKTQHRLGGHRLAGVVQGIEPDRRFVWFVHSGIVRQTYCPQIAPFDALADGEFWRHHSGKILAQPIQRGFDFRQGTKATHGGGGSLRRANSLTKQEQASESRRIWEKACFHGHCISGIVLLFRVCDEKMSRTLLGCPILSCCAN